jgi:hypothetical protein
VQCSAMLLSTNVSSGRRNVLSRKDRIKDFMAVMHTPKEYTETSIQSAGKEVSECFFKTMDYLLNVQFKTWRDTNSFSSYFC